MDGAWVAESVVGVAAAMLCVFSSLEVLAQPPRHVGKQLVQGRFCLTQRQFRHRPVRLQWQQVNFVECCQHDSPFPPYIRMQNRSTLSTCANLE